MKESITNAIYMAAGLLFVAAVVAYSTSCEVAVSTASASETPPKVQAPPNALKRHGEATIDGRSVVILRDNECGDKYLFVDGRLVAVNGNYVEQFKTITVIRKEGDPDLADGEIIRLDN
jgi:hypothetical protein